MHAVAVSLGMLLLSSQPTAFAAFDGTWRGELFVVYKPSFFSQSEAIPYRLIVSSGEVLLAIKTDDDTWSREAECTVLFQSDTHLSVFLLVDTGSFVEEFQVSLVLVAPDEVAASVKRTVNNYRVPGKHEFRTFTMLLSGQMTRDPVPRDVERMPMVNGDSASETGRVWPPNTPLQWTSGFVTQFACANCAPIPSATERHR